MSVSCLESSLGKFYSCHFEVGRVHSLRTYRTRASVSQWQFTRSYLLFFSYKLHQQIRVGKRKRRDGNRWTETSSKTEVAVVYSLITKAISLHLVILYWNKNYVKSHIRGPMGPPQTLSTPRMQEADNFLLFSWVFKSGPAGYHKNQLLAGTMMMLREMRSWEERVQMRRVVSKRTTMVILDCPP